MRRSLLGLLCLATCIATPALAQRRATRTPTRRAPPTITRVVGALQCQMPDGSLEPLPHVAVEIGGLNGVTQADGTIALEGSPGPLPLEIEVCYDSVVPNPGSLSSAGLLIVDEVQASRAEDVSTNGWLVNGTLATLGTLTLEGTDCALWVGGVEVLDFYQAQVGDPPPANELRFKRWSAINVDIGTPHAFYDMVVVPTDYFEMWDVDTLHHEFAHTVRHVADGSEAHWHGDNLLFIYGRSHNGTEITNKQYAFNEGWAQYWDHFAGPFAAIPNYGQPSIDYLDWNEMRVGQRLLDLNNEESPALMHEVLIDNPGTHTVFEFEQRYCEATVNNAFCTGGVPDRAPPPDCPPEYIDDGLTCRLDNIKAKPSYGRGVGTVPTDCGPGKELDAGLCYPNCAPGYEGVGPVCWQSCPSGYTDDGAFCRKDAHIFTANTSACPWYDECGLTFAKGCSSCPAGYINDGCTCRKNAHIFAKNSYGRGVGLVPSSCAGSKEMDAGLCYWPCAAGFDGVGPVCWGSCAPGFDDHGATCYKAPHVFGQH